MRMSLAEIADCLNVSIPSQRPVAIEGVSIDSRRIKPGDLFVCIRGERYDGHDFAAKAAENGAAALLASERIENAGVPVLQVGDTVEALGQLASCWRKKSAAKVICLTGTAGKTTLKDTLAAILSQDGKTASSKGNHNNQIGLPLTILEANGDEKYWVLEAGISRAGDMEHLGGIARPDLAIILNVGKGHTEGLGGEGVAWHKTRLLRHVNKKGGALICADYPDLLAETAKLNIKPTLFSTLGKAGADYGAVSGEDLPEGSYRLTSSNGGHVFQTPFFGEYGAETALAAAAAADMLGLDKALIQKGFQEVRLAPQRFSLREKGGWHIFDDTYNANPLSMNRMLSAAKNFARKHDLPFMAVLGHMGELGKEAGKCHRDLGRSLARLEPEAIFWKGEFYGDVLSGFLELSPGKKNILRHFEKAEEFISLWNDLAARNDGCDKGVVLFKGSRVNRMEETLARFEKHCADKGERDVL